MAHYRNGDDKAAVAELEMAMNLQAGGSSFDWFFLAMAHWRLGDCDKARTWFDRAVTWMDSHKPHDQELRRFRAEASAMLAETLLSIAWTSWLSRRRALEEAVNAKDQSAVIFHAGRLILSQPHNPEWYSYRGSAHAELGQWDGARADFGQAAHLSPENVWFWYCHAIAYLGAGDAAGYHAVCTRMIQRFAHSPQATQSCLYACAPDRLAGANAEQLVAMGKAAVAESKAKVGKGIQAWRFGVVLRAHAAALYRAGQDREAIQHWQDAAKFFSPRAWDWLFLAMAHHRLGEAAKAQDYLARARDWITTAGDAARKGSNWYHWLEQTEVQALRREAETLLNGTR
jgi:tetratricopeptide (TPR) repeat protein